MAPPNAPNDSPEANEFEQGDIAARQSEQDDQYVFPYHYIPINDARGHRRTRHWGWGFRYLGGIDVVLDALDESPFGSLIDIGCGDGRFLHEFAKIHPDVAARGVDSSQRAIRLARALNPSVRFEAADICHAPVGGPFDAATLIEVLEHIPPQQVPEFLQATAGLIAPGGRLVLTVPHVNKPVDDKHFQHFSSVSLTETLSPFFGQVVVRPFDDIRAPALKLFSQILGASGRFFVITHPSLNERYYRLYRTRYLFSCTEARCGRLLAVCTP